MLNLPGDYEARYCFVIIYPLKNAMFIYFVRIAPSIATVRLRFILNRIKEKEEEKGIFLGIFTFIWNVISH